MRLANYPVLESIPLTRCLGQRRQCAAIFTCLLLAGFPGAPAPAAEAVAKRGGVAIDEPAAARVAVDILTAGGNAADAAVAAAFALSVSLPSRAGLGGGGVCLIHDPATGRTDALDFLAPAAAGDGAGEGSAAAVPAMPRGLFALHARFGLLDWPALVAPAESLARDGVSVSRALAADLARIGGPAPIGAAAARLVPEDRLVEAELGQTLAEIGRLGAELFDGGGFTRRLAQAMSAAGGAVAADRVAAYQPRWRLPISVAGERWSLVFAPPPATGGLLEAQMWAMLDAGDRYARAPAVQRPHLFVEVARRAFAQRHLWMLPDGSPGTPIRTVLDSRRIEALMAGYVAHRRSRTAATGLIAGTAPAEDEAGAATGFVTVDRNGGAVACNLTVHALFGTRRKAQGMGFLVVPAPHRDRREWALLGPMLALTTERRGLGMAAAAAGGGNAPTALVSVALNSLVGGRPLAEAMSLMRFHHRDGSDAVEAESGVSEPRLMTLHRRGHRVRTVSMRGRVNAASCVEGPSEGCTVASDPRGHGVALAAE